MKELRALELWVEWCREARFFDFVGVEDGYLGRGRNMDNTFGNIGSTNYISTHSSSYQSHLPFISNATSHPRQTRQRQQSQIIRTHTF